MLLLPLTTISAVHAKTPVCCATKVLDVTVLLVSCEVVTGSLSVNTGVASAVPHVLGAHRANTT